MAQAPFKPVYLLVGDDAHLRDTYRREIHEQVVGQADVQLCVRVFEGEFTVAQVLDELRTLPFLAPARLVIVRDGEALLGSEENRDALEHYLESPNPHSALVLIASSVRPSNLIKRIEETGRVLRCEAKSDENLSAWLTRAAQKRGKQIDRDAADLLAQWVGHDQARLETEVEKLTLFVGNRPRITTQDVSEIVADAAGPGAYEVTNHLMVPDARAALAALDRALVGSSDAYAVLGTIAWHLRRMLAAGQLVASGTPAVQATPTRMPYAARQLMARLLQRRSLERMRQDLREALSADLAIKSGADGAAVLQGLVINLCS